MAYNKKVWVNRQTENPTRRKLTPTGAQDVYDVSREEGLVTVEGDAFNAATMNDLEERIDDGLSEMVPKSGDTMTGSLIAGGTQDIATAQVRNILASTTDLEAGVSELDTGVLYLVYE